MTNIYSKHLLYVSPTTYAAVIIIFISISCQKSSKSRIPNALTQNPQFMDVINHFSTTDKNDEKLEAAYFLIENMQYHFGNEKLYKAPAYYRSAFEFNYSLLEKYLSHDTIVKNEVFEKLNYTDRTFFTGDSSRINHERVERDTVYDVSVITADYLINHIDAVFEIKEQSAFAKNLSKQEFYEGILSLRIKNEPLDTIETYRNAFRKVFEGDSLSSLDINYRLNNLLNGFRKFNKHTPLIQNFGAYSILDNWERDCLKEATYAVKILRSNGIASFIDFTPQWKDRISRRNHYWCAIKDDDGLYQGFSPRYQVINNKETRQQLQPASKVFRFTYQINHDTPFMKKKRDEYLPRVFDTPYIKDVTSEYFPVTNIKIKLDSIPKNKFCYLSTFNPPQWCPVDYDLINKKDQTVNFEQVTLDCVYGVVSYNEFGRPTLLYPPFYISSDSTLALIDIAKNQNTSMRLFQKYPQKKEISKEVCKIIGARFQGANNPDFSDAVDLYEIKDYPKPIIHNIPVNIEEKFRYARIISSKPKQSLNIAHLEFHTDEPSQENSIGLLPYFLSKVDDDSIKDLNHPTKLNGKLYSSIGKYLNSPMTQMREKGYDGNFNTYSLAAEISFDFGKPQSISSIRYAPRNADNWIKSGNRYELRYLDGKKWVVLSRKESTFNFVEFENVPEGTLYWLRNLDEGKEELPFAFYNNKQLFSNYEDINQVFATPKTSLHEK